MQFQAVKCAKKEYRYKWGSRINVCSNSSRHHVKAHFIKYLFSYSSIKISSPHHQ